MSSLLSDFKYVLRRWRRTPLVAAIAILSLAIGIGANTALFAALNALLLKPLPGENPERLVRLRDERRPAPNTRVPTRVWERLRADESVLDGLAAYAKLPLDVSLHGEPASEVNGLAVSGSYFGVLRPRAALGRLLTESDDVAGAPTVGVMSHAYWSRALGADTTVVGRTVSVEGRAVEIVGVSERGFFGLDVGQTFDIAISLESQRQFDQGAMAGAANAYWLNVAGRLKPGDDRARAQAALRTLQPAIAGATLPRPSFKETHLAAPWVLERASETTFGARETYRQALWILLIIAAAVLIVACVNIANILLVQNGAARREFGMRLSIGAQPSQLVRSIFVEAFALMATATALGLAIGLFGSRVLVSMFSSVRNPVYLDVSLDARVIAFTVAVCSTIAVVCASLPAWRALRVDPVDAMRQEPAMPRVRGRALMPYLLLSAQVAVVFALSGVGLALVRSFLNLTAQDYGFDRDRVVVASISIVDLKVPNDAKPAVAAALRNEIARLPDVRGAALSMSAPFGATIYSTSIGDGEDKTYFSYVGPDYFTLMGKVASRGSLFSADPDPNVAVITETLARSQFGNSDPVGQSIRLRGMESPFRVIGVTSDIKMRSLREEGPSFVYLPWLSSTGPPGTLIHVFLRVPSAQAFPARAVSAAVERAVPGATVLVRTLDQEVAGTFVTERAMALLATVFGLLAVLLGALGLYGVTAYQVNRRAKEFGVRMALGATGGAVSRMIVSEIAVVSVGGVVAGIVLTSAIASRIATLLFRASPMSPGLLVLTAGLVVTIAVLAGYYPARQAASLDPMKAIRQV